MIVVSCLTLFNRERRFCNQLEEIRDLNSRGMESDRQFRLRQQTSTQDE